MTSLLHKRSGQPTKKKPAVVKTCSLLELLAKKDATLVMQKKSLQKLPRTLKYLKHIHHLVILMHWLAREKDGVRIRNEIRKHKRHWHCHHQLHWIGSRSRSYRSSTCLSLYCIQQDQWTKTRRPNCLFRKIKSQNKIRNKKSHGSQ